MQTIYDLTNKEVNKLTYEQVDRFIDIACAEAGTMLLPEVPIEPKLDKPAKDAFVYKVGEFKVGTPEEASKLLEFLNTVQLLETSYDYACGYDDKYITAIQTSNEPDIKKEAVYTAETYSKIKSLLQKYNDAKKDYEQKRKDYQKADSDRNKISSQIWEHVNNIKDKFSQKDRLKKEFNRYLNLADGDKEIALKFFENAFVGELANMDDGEEFEKSLLQ
jgi:hypothetical protein